MVQKKIIIIGATSGLGLELARIYVNRGHLVAVTGRRKTLLDQLRLDFPQQIITACFDVMGRENIAHLQKIIDQMGGMDLLVYNAGYGEPSKTLEWGIEQTSVATNVMGFTEVVHFAFNYFLSRGQGQIALTSSVAALRGNSWAPAYSASKAYMSNYAEGLNIKAWRMKKNIVITDLRPGFVDTKLAKGNKRFWVAPPSKAALQMARAIDQKKRVAYITRRWQLLAPLIKWLPYFMYRRLV